MTGLTGQVGLMARLCEKVGVSLIGEQVSPLHVYHQVLLPCFGARTSAALLCLTHAAQPVGFTSAFAHVNMCSVLCTTAF